MGLGLGLVLGLVLGVTLRIGTCCCCCCCSCRGGVGSKRRFPRSATPGSIAGSTLRSMPPSKCIVKVSRSGEASDGVFPAFKPLQAVTARKHEAVRLMREANRVNRAP